MIWLQANWAKVAAGAVAVALALALAWMHGNARFAAGELTERTAWQAVVTAKEKEIADLRVANERRGADAAVKYADRLAVLEPIIIRSTDTVTRYASTPAGAAICLGPDRVSGIDADAAALGLQPATTPDDGDRAVRPDGDSPQP